MEKEILLEARHIKKEFLRQGRSTNVHTAVRETNLALHAGTLTVLKGRSGSGKTTLLHILAGLLSPTAGQVFVYKRDRADAGTDREGTDLYALSDEKRARLRGRHIGCVPQGESAVGSLTVLENVLLPYTLDDGARAADTDAHRREALSLLERLGIDSLQNERPSSLSGGELRRLAIARALVRHPALVFADEPTGDLDETSTRIVFSLLRDTARGGSAVFIVTHENDADAYADTVLHMDGGVCSLTQQRLF